MKISSAKCRTFCSCLNLLVLKSTADYDITHFLNLQRNKIWICVPLQVQNTIKPMLKVCLIFGGNKSKIPSPHSILQNPTVLQYMSLVANLRFDKLNHMPLTSKYGPRICSRTGRSDCSPLFSVATQHTVLLERIVSGVTVVVSVYNRIAPWSMLLKSYAKVSVGCS